MLIFRARENYGGDVEISWQNRIGNISHKGFYFNISLCLAEL